MGEHFSSREKLVSFIVVSTARREFANKIEVGLKNLRSGLALWMADIQASPDLKNSFNAFVEGYFPERIF